MKILKQIADDKKAMAQSLYYQSGIAVGYDMVIPTEDQNDNPENEHDKPTAAKRRRTTAPNNKKNNQRNNVPLVVSSATAENLPRCAR